MTSAGDDNFLGVYYDGQLDPSAQIPLPGAISTTPVTGNTVSTTLAPYSASILNVGPART